MTLAFAVGEDGWKRSVTEPRADAPYYYVYLPSLVLDGDLDFSNQYAVTKNWYRFARTPRGRPSNVFGIGPAVFELPAFLVGHAIAVASGGRTDGFSRWETVLCMWASIPFTLGAMLFAYRLARRRLGPGLHAYAGPLLALISGPALYYAIRQPGYAHPFAAFFATWLVERWDASYDGTRPRSGKTWMALGAVAGCAALARPQLAMWGALLLPLAVIDDARNRGEAGWLRLVMRWIAAAGVIFLVVSPQVIAWRSLYGAWWLVPQGDGFMRWDSPAWSETLFSSRNGLLPWAPLYPPMLACALLLARRRPRLVLPLVFGLLGQAVVNGAAWDWWAGGSFGGRRFDSTYVLFALGAAAGLQWAFLAIRRFHDTQCSWKNGSVNRRFTAATVVLVVVVLVGVATVELAMKTSVTSVRIDGGSSAASVWQKYGVHGRLAAWLSRAANAPARLLYALRYDVGLSAYDRCVGVHYLGDRYPGLNASPDKTRDTIELGRPDVRHRGVVPLGPGRARITGGSARLLVGLNRRGGVLLRIPVELEAPAVVTVAWNGDPQRFQLPAGASTLKVSGSPLRRGTNVLELTTPGEMIVKSIEIRASE